MTEHEFCDRPAEPSGVQEAKGVQEARAALTVADAVGLALRAHRRAVGMSQRDYAGYRGWSHARVARLEAKAGGLKLADVIEALEPTGFRLALVQEAPDEPPTPTHPGAALAWGGAPRGVSEPRPSGHRRLREVTPEAWEAAELVARVRGGWRRFPGHLVARPTEHGPRWWINGEATWAYAVPPEWTTAG